MPTVLPNIEEKEETKPKEPGGPWLVILWDDDEHTYDYVVTMLVDVCNIPPEKAFQHAVEVDTYKKTIVFTGEFEHAEHIHDRIINYGPDLRMSNCKGSMSATLEQV